METDYGDAMTVVLGFEPANVKDLERTSISAVLVNDSNYFLDYVLLRRAEAGAGWKVVSRGEAAPNELVDLASYTQQTIKELERIVFQAVAYKSYKDFEVKSPLNVSRKLDLTKFFKLHCFRPGVYFDRPAIEVTLYKEQEPRRAALPKKERKMKERWWTAPAESDDGRTVIVTGRDYLDKERESGKFPYLVRVGWDYDPLPDGMPRDEDAILMEQATDAMLSTFKKDKVAYLTGIYTGAGRRDWVFHAHNLNIFGKVFNRALADIPQMPILIEAEDDPGWEEYKQMREATYIPEDDEE